MQPTVSIAVQFTLVVLALSVTTLRCYVRLFVERRKLTLSDYLVWGAWLCALSFSICSVIALQLLSGHPLVEPEGLTDSVAYLKTVFAMCYLFDFGLYFPKTSLVAFYWWLIPQSFRRLRFAIYAATVYVGCAFTVTCLSDTLHVRPISHNWSLEYQSLSVWNSWKACAISWALNWSTDLLLFILPFFIINYLKLHKRQKIALYGVFSLGLITMLFSLSRFIMVTVMGHRITDGTSHLWCTAEMCTATIVVSLPALKPLIVRSTPSSTPYRSTNGYINASSAKLPGNHATCRSNVQCGRISDDELELVFQELPMPSQTVSRTRSSVGIKDDAMMKTDWTVESHAV